MSSAPAGLRKAVKPAPSEARPADEAAPDQAAGARRPSPAKASAPSVSPDPGSTGQGPKLVIFGLAAAWTALAAAAVASVLSTPVPPGVVELFAAILVGAAGVIVAAAVVSAASARAMSTDLRRAADLAARRAEQEAARRADRQEAIVLMAFVAGVLGRQAARLRKTLAQRPPLPPEDLDDADGDYIDDGGSGAFHITPPPALDRLFTLLPALRPTHRAALERLLATLDEIQSVTRSVPPGSGVDTAIDRAHLDRALQDLIRLAGRLRQEEGRADEA